MRRLAFERRTAATSRGELTYQVTGEGPLLLLAGGLGAGAAAFNAQIAHFGDRYRCVVWDYRGLHTEQRGESQACSVEQHAQDALALLDAEGATRAAVLGWSMGVQVALELFRLEPARVALLTLVNGGCQASWGKGIDAGPLRRLYPKALTLLEYAPHMFEQWARQAVRSPEAFTWARRMGLVGSGIDADLFAEVARTWLDVDARALFRTLRELESHSACDVLADVDVPTLVMGGDRDPFTSRASLERLVNGIAGAEYLLLPGAGHYVLLDHAQHVNLRIEKLFSERGF